MSNKDSATHTGCYGDEKFYFMKIDGVWYEYRESCDEFFKSTWKHHEWLSPIKKPRTKVVYEKVEDLIFTLQDDLDKGKLYGINDDGSHWKIATTHTLAGAYNDRELYRKVEKEIDWKDELSFFFGRLDYGVVERIEYHQGEIGLSMEINEIDFISMCHLVASLTDNQE